MKNGFVIVGDDDGMLYGHGDTEAMAWTDAGEWIEDAVSDEVSQALRESKMRGVPCYIEGGVWRLFPATAALRASIDLRGGHDEWLKGLDGVLDVHPPIQQDGA